MYARGIGMTVQQVSLFMFVLIMGAAVFQWPIGKLSDQMDRCHMIALLALVGALACALAVPLGHLGPTWLIVMAVPIGATLLPMYSIAIAHTNDYVDEHQRVAASGVLTLVFGLGAVLGPSTAGAVMDLLGADGYLWMMASVLGLLVLFELLRSRRAPTMPAEEQSPYTPSPQRTASLSEAYVESGWGDETDTQARGE